MKHLFSALACTFLLTTPVFAKAPPPTENLYCHGPLESTMQRLTVILLSGNHELVVNGDVHYMKSTRIDNDSHMLYTYDYVDFHNRFVYIALISVNIGKDKGIYLVQYQADTDKPLMVTPLTCHRFKE